MRSLSFLIILIAVFSFYAYAQSPHGPNLKMDCSDCHIASSWKVIPKNIKFNHDKTNFPLDGQHKNVPCQSCHTSLVFAKAAASTDCFSCHKDIHQGSVGYDCARCHTPQSWVVQNINEIHEEYRFPLVGAHLNADCIQCHAGYENNNFEPYGTTCFDCHKSNYYATTNPNHVQAGFSTNCVECHTENAQDWAASAFNHDFFPLVGGHKIANCFDCHKSGGDFSGLSTDCYSCHKKDYDNTNNPNHMSANFSTDCTQCHTIMTWASANFDHNQTGFPLTGKHATVSCQNCHTNGYTNTPTDCYSCHQADFQNTNDPNHVAQGFPTDCSQCHSTNGWGDATFDHNNTGFPLTGAHVNVSCAQCHTNGYTNTPTDCYSCHQADFQNTTDPNHVALGYPHDCTQCHNTSGWGDAIFDHNNTGFPLTGAHVSVSCAQCHTNGYANTPTDCYSCHQSNYQGTSNPNHQNLGISTDCQTCHTTDPGWSPALFPQHSQYFELVGAHANITDCNDCHNGNYVNPPNTCYGCHESDFTNTTNPPHVAENFSHDCTTCHNMNGWTPANFDHSFYVLGSNHANVSCNECHSEANYGPQCLSCHQNAFNQGHNPGDPTDCWDCHNTSNWGDSNFDHNNYWPLTGAHTTVACTQCHTNGYANTPTDCYSCHQSNYEATNNPNHQNLSISTDCQTCHTTNPGWAPATFPQHGQYFELVGAHANITNCDDCHNGNYVNPPNTCYGCHESDFTNTTDPPHVSQNFSHDCTTCHNMNGWTPANFDHSFYALASPHNTFNCSECHTEANYGPQCLSCHQSQFNEGHNPGDPTDCWDCHSTSHFGDGPAILKQKGKVID
jgi:Cytochrome c3